MSDLARFDPWIKDGGPAALVIREQLVPIDGSDGVFFPATFAAGEGFEGGYNIDRWREGDVDKSVCLVDSVGAQANRIEPLFMKEQYLKLVPQINVKAGSKTVSILEAGHRAGDALVRCSALQQRLADAFQAVIKGNAEPLAKIAPTSLVFGVWDSRGSQAKLPRLFSSTIRAFDVRELKRSANYLVQQVVDYVDETLLPLYESKAEKEEYSKKGFLNALATRTHGGVIAQGGIRRDVTLSLSALRLLAVREGTNPALLADRTEALRRYILGLSLVAFTASQESYLRQGCLLVPDFDKPRETSLVHGDGKREALSLDAAQALAYAKGAAEAFGVGHSEDVEFDKSRAESEVGRATEVKPAPAKRRGKP